jgi:hypothetical protein
VLRKGGASLSTSPPDNDALPVSSLRRGFDRLRSLFGEEAEQRSKFPFALPVLRLRQTGRFQ